jgi:hypothetical protein
MKSALLIAFVLVAALSCAPSSSDLPRDILPPLEQYQTVSSLGALPAIWRDSFLQVFSLQERKGPAADSRTGDPRLLIAEAGQAYQATDIVDRSLPQRQFIAAAMGPQPVLFYLHGGIGKHMHALFLSRIQGQVRIVRNLWVPIDLFPPSHSVPDLWHALQSEPLIHAQPGDA